MTRAAPLASFTLACLGIAIYSGMDVLMKGLSLASGAYAAVLWRSIAGVILTGSVFVAGGRRWPGRVALRLHIARGSVAGASVLLFFWGLERTAMAKAVALTFLAPLIALFLAAWLLGERIHRGAIIASIIATAGIAVIVAGEWRAGDDDSLLGSAAILLASFLYAYSLILLRRQAQVADPLEVTLFTSLVIAALMLPAAPFLTGLPAVSQLPIIGAAAVLGTISAFLLAYAYARAEAQLLAQVEYTAFFWAALFGWLFFDERVSRTTLAGTALIVVACLAAVRRPAGAVAQSEAGA